MPIFRSHTTIEIARGLKAFLSLQVGLTRFRAPELDKNAPTRRSDNAAQVRMRLDQACRRLKQARQQLVDKDREIAEWRTKFAGSKADSIRPENIVWIFGHGRSGSTWLVSMMGELENHTGWRDPHSGDLFGHLYYERATDVQRKFPHFILGGQKKTILQPMRSFVLEAASLRFPQVKSDGILVIHEVHSSIGAPLLMEALPESSMILLVREPRDAVASDLDATRKGGWVYEQLDSKKREELISATMQPDIYVKSVAESYLQSIEKAKQAYDAHRGRKVLVKYEDLVAGTLEAMKRVYSTLDIPLDKEELARAVEKYSWENIPEDQKGEGKFYRKGVSGGWREDFTLEQAKIVERVTTPVLDEFYPLAEKAAT